MEAYYKTMHTPIGELCIIANEYGVTHIGLFKEEWEKLIKEEYRTQKYSKWCEQAVNELKEYFEGTHKVFSVPLSIEGTPFRKKVWSALQTIPYGQVTTYKNVAIELGNEKAVRAVGNANRANPIPIIIPCHRVIGSDGKLVGYAGTHTDIKKTLIEIEEKHMTL